jgi:gas vesicle protein
MDFDFRRHDDTTATFLTGFATGLFLGALAMFIFDPQQGPRRRALVRDKMVRYGNEASDYVSGAAKDLSNRAYGVAKETEGLVRDKIGGQASAAPSSQNPLATTGGI